MEKNRIKEMVSLRINLRMRRKRMYDQNATLDNSGHQMKVKVGEHDTSTTF